jgi:hypothetical protein
MTSPNSLRVSSGWACIVSEGTEADPGIFVEIPLAEFQETAKGSQYPEITVDRFPGEGVEHHVHPPAIGLGQDFVGKSQ